MPVERGISLYLSLEDPERRLHKRIRRLADEDADLGGFHYATEWPSADRGGVEQLDGWLGENPECRLVVIDTLKRIRPQASGKRNMYDDDYEALQPYVPIANKHNVAIVVLHHLNQQSDPHDPFDAFSGSSGLTAATEQIWLLTRKRGDADAYLMIDGKDIEEPQELALGWDAITCSWTAQGDAATYRLNKERREVIELLIREDEPMGPKAVAELLGKGYDATKQMMKRMGDDGQLKQEGYGKYVPASLGGGYSSLSSHSSTSGLGVTRVTGVTPPERENSHPPLSADEANRLMQQWINEGMKESEAFEAVRQAVAYAIEAGRMLEEAKAGLKHGEWLGWLEANFEGSQQTASIYMRFAKRQAELNYQRVGNLSLRSAMIALEAEDKRRKRDRKRQERLEAVKQLSTSSEAWHHGDWREYLPTLEDESVSLLLTDPPYGINWRSNHRTVKHDAIENDNELQALKNLAAMLCVVYPKLVPDAHVVLFTSPRLERRFLGTVEDAGYDLRSYLVWVKNHTGMGNLEGAFAPKHERLIHAAKGAPTMAYRAPDVL